MRKLETGVNNVSCHICHSNENASTIVLCIECSKGYHMKCLLPPLTELPILNGDWFCSDCTRKSQENVKQNSSPPLQNMKNISSPPPKTPHYYMHHQTGYHRYPPKPMNHLGYYPMTTLVQDYEINNYESMYAKLPTLEPLPQINMTRNIYDVLPSKTFDFIDWNFFKIKLSIDFERRNNFKYTVNKIRFEPVAEKVMDDFMHIKQSKIPSHLSFA